MSKRVTIGTESFDLPTQGVNPPWGEEMSDIIEALINSVNTVQGPYDIQETSANIENTVGEKNIIGLAFDANNVRSAEISYNVSRTINKTISAIPTGTGVIQIDFSDSHNLFVGDKLTISGSNSTPSIDGTYTVVSKVDSDSLTIDISAVTVSVAGTAGTVNVELGESGILLINYTQQVWSISQELIGNSEVILDINQSGQFTYTPTVLDGTTHVGLIKFIAKTLISS